MQVLPALFEPRDFFSAETIQPYDASAEQQNQYEGRRLAP